MISAILKEETKSLHTETEKRLNAKRIFSEDFTVQEYVKILQVLYIAHLLLEKQLENIRDPHLFRFYQKHYTPHTHLIKKDLENLHAFAKPKTPINTQEMNDMNALGILYVLKGSSMGAIYIHKQLQETARRWPHFSGKFYQTSASQTIEDWKNFCSSLETLGLTSENVNEVIEGARLAFKTFIDSSAVVFENLQKS